MAAAGFVAVLIAITGATGGLASDGTGPATKPIGATIDQVHFRSTVLGAQWTRKKVLGKVQRSIAVRLRVTNTADRPAALLDYLKSVIPLQAWAGGLLSADGKAYTGGTETDQLTPGIPTDVVVNYTPDDSQAHTTRLDLRFCGYEHRSDFYYSGHQVWVVGCLGWSVFDPREMVSPRDISGPGVTPAVARKKARELNEQGHAARKSKVYATDGVVAEVDLTVKGGA